MGDNGVGKGMLSGLIVSIVVALVFLVLWFVRGGEVDRLGGELTAARNASASAESRLRDELQAARNAANLSSGKVTELETRLRDDARRATEDASRLERRLRDEMYETQGLLEQAQGELKTLQESVAAKVAEEKSGLQRDLDKTRKELESLRAAGDGEVKRLTAEAEEARASIRALQARLAGEAAEAEAVERDPKAGAGETAASELTRLKADLSALALSLAEAKNANSALEQVRDSLAETLMQEKEVADDREAELLKTIASLSAAKEPSAPAASGNGEWREKAANLEKEAADAGTRVAALEKLLEAAAREAETLLRRAEEAEKRAGEIEKAGEEASGRAASEYQAMEDSWRIRVAAQQKEFDSQLRRRRAELEAAEASWRERFAGAEKNAATAADSYEKQIAGLRERLKISEGALENAEKARAEQLSLLETTLKARHAQALKSLRDGLRGVEERYRVRQEALEKRFEEMKAVAGLDEAGFALTRPGRTVGKLMERLPDGQTLLMTGGSRQRVRHGMKFDVYRPVGDRNRHIGTVRVIRPLDDYSMVVSNFDDADVMVCPATGRAVLEPGARFSPFAVDRDGKPLKLKKAGSVGLSLEAPAIGDLVDNPFYDPERRIVIAASDELARDPCVVKAAEALGAQLRAGDPGDADFLLVEDGAAGNGLFDTGPRRVTWSHLASYLYPTPVR